MFKLHYASLDLRDNDIPCFEFKKHFQMIDFIDEKCINRNGQVVWLLAKKGSTDIFISENHLSIQDYFTKKYIWDIPDDYFIHELTIKELNSIPVNLEDIKALDAVFDGWDA